MLSLPVTPAEQENDRERRRDDNSHHRLAAKTDKLASGDGRGDDDTCHARMAYDT